MLVPGLSLARLQHQIPHANMLVLEHDPLTDVDKRHRAAVWRDEDVSEGHDQFGQHLGFVMDMRARNVTARHVHLAGRQALDRRCFAVHDWSQVLPCALSVAFW